MANPTTLVEQFDGDPGVFAVSGVEQYDNGLWIGYIPTYSDLILATPGLVAYWPLDDAAGATSADLGPGGHDGANTGTAAGASLVPSETGGASAELTNASADRIEITDHTDFDTNLVSIEAWVQWVGGWKAHCPIFNLRTAGNVGGYTLQTTSNSGELIFYVNDGAGFQSDVSAGWTAGTIWHVVVTFDGTTTRFYRDGALVTTGSTTFDGSLNQPASALIAIGNDVTALFSNFEWTGFIDAVSLYGVALDATTIEQHYEAGAGTLAGSSASVATTGIITPDAGAIAFRNTRKIDTGAEEIILNVGTVGAATDAMRIGYDATDHPFMEFNSNNAGWQRVTATATVAATVEALLYFDWTGTTIRVSVDNGALDSDTRDAVEDDWGAGDLILGSG